MICEIDWSEQKQNKGPMSNRKGELTAAGIDRGWPHKVALAAHLCTGKLIAAHNEFCVGLSRCVRGHSVRYVVHCFTVSRSVTTLPHSS
jgi:hypothetical protein